MLYVGLDLHSKHISVCVLDERGNRVLQTEVRTVDALGKILERLGDRFEVCFEASCGYGWYFDLLRPLASKVVVAHPGHLRLIFRSKHKNDRKDAERLAKLLFLGEVPTVHVPESNVRAWRELITCRRHMVEKRTKAKNGVRSLLRSIGQVAPRRPGLWTKKGRACLLSIPMTSSTALRRDLLLDEIDHLSSQIGRVEKELDRIAEELRGIRRTDPSHKQGLRQTPFGRIAESREIVAAQNCFASYGVSVPYRSRSKNC